MVDLSERQQEQVREDGMFKEASRAVDDLLKLHKGDHFTLDDMCRWLELHDAAKRKKVAQKLAYEVSQGRLEKSTRSRPSIYRYVDNTLVRMDWVNVRAAANLDLAWPVGSDGTQFSFDGKVAIPQKGLVVLAGVTNTGKSVFCRNFLWMNMDKYHCLYFSSETSEEDFSEYASRMTWGKPLKEDGTPKFDLIARERDFKDVIDPDGINIIDWLNLKDAFYEVGDILAGIKGRLKTGIALIALQKDPSKELGMGGMWGEHLASLYLTFDFEKMTVKKAKKWQGKLNPNGKTCGFSVVDYGTHFAQIRPIRKCPGCFGSGRSRGMECSDCGGSGWIDEETK